MGYDAESARGLIRVSLGRFNTQQEVDRFLEVLRYYRAQSPRCPPQQSPRTSFGVPILRWQPSPEQAADGASL